jgi:hypothetical protein
VARPRSCRRAGTGSRRRPAEKRLADRRVVARVLGRSLRRPPPGTGGGRDGDDRDPQPRARRGRPTGTGISSSTASEHGTSTRKGPVSSSTSSSTTAR